MRTLAFAVWVAALLPAIWLSGSSSAQAANLIPLRVAYDGYSMTTAPLNYAVQRGIFKKYGLDVSLVYIDAGTTLSQAVVGGSIDIAQNGYTPAIAAAVQGADVVFIGGISNTLPFQLIVKKGITNAATLRGKKIAISRIGSSTDIAVTYALRHLGLSRSDVTILQLGGEGTRTVAMLSGQIDGAVEQYPRTGDLEGKGYVVLVDDTTVATNYPNTSYVSTRAFVKQHSDIVKRFMMGISDGIHQFKSNKADAIRSTAEFLKMSPDASLDKAYDVFTKEVYPDVPRPSLKGISVVLNELKATVPRAAFVKPESLVNTTALDQLQKEGFFVRLH